MSVCKCESADDAACGMWEGSWQAAVGVAVKAVAAAEVRWLLEFLEPRQMEKKDAHHAVPPLVSVAVCQSRLVYVSMSTCASMTFN